MANIFCFNLLVLVVCLLLGPLLIIRSYGQEIAQKGQTYTNELIKIDRKNDYIFLNTIDGKLYAIGKHDGKIKWSLKEDAVLNFPKDYENPYFLTDPRDGSLYIFTSKKDGLKKFPYTIAELVSASPSKSADGFLYTGDKKDQWLAVDYRNGNKLDTLTAETLSSKVSNANDNVIFIGRTKYTISMFDVNTRRKIFNLTYYDYSTHSFKKQSQNEYDPQNSYPSYHFTSSSDGTLITVDKKTGELKWHLKLDNPIVAMYRYEMEQLFKISFSIYSVEALSYLAKTPKRIRLLYKQHKHNELILKSGSTSSSQPKSNIANMFSETLYVGFYNKNLYALPSFVYNPKVPLIEGPPNNENPLVPISNGEENINNSYLIDWLEELEEDFEDEINNSISSNSISYDDGSTSGEKDLLGHHKPPDDFEAPPDFIQPNDKLMFITTSKENQNENLIYLQELFNIKNPPICRVDELSESDVRHSKLDETNNMKFGFWKTFDMLMQNKYVWSIFTVFLASLFPISKTIYDYRKKRARQLLRQQAQIMLEKKNLPDELSTSSSDEEHIDQLRPIEHFNSSNSKKISRDSRGSKSSNEMVSNEKEELTKRNNSSTKISNPIHGSYSLPEIRSDGLIQIGKVTYDPKQVLGHGCAGTFVYKGTFENRPVAVKRLLPECYTLADREVELLRDADQHANVLRYFCTESDSQFRYIALELCQMTLYEYITNGMSNLLRPLAILEQATKGLDHLHSLDIVHRDIKPQNVLISFPDQKGNIYVMISDFGLCKRLETGINSFSKRSGITGTDGWIAPELIDDIYINNSAAREEEDTSENSNTNVNELQTSQSSANSINLIKRVTKNVDIFSMGCVYYFVLSGGAHPFGDSIRRQLNILSNEFKLDRLLSNLFSEVHMQRILIDKMISNDPKKRPPTKEILAHPIFWSKAKTLQFLQDVSDRIEKIEQDDLINIELERNANVAIKNNWKCHICPQLQSDLKKFRTYNGISVRDLLRAIRNKKHHYRELPPEVKQSLGNLPDEFVDYFTTRFPKLIMHVYDAMRCCADEPMLDVYYKLMTA